MLRFIVRRLLQGIPILIGAISVVFLLLHVVGPDPVIGRLGKSASAEEIAAKRKAGGFDQPLSVQYVQTLKQTFTFDFGRSWVTNQSVRSMIGERAGPSLSLMIPGLLFTTMLAVSIGMIAAYYRGRGIDRGLMILAVFGMSISFLVYIVVFQYLLAYRLPLFQIHGYEPGWAVRWQYLVLPIIVQVIVGMGYDTRFYRSVMVEEVGKDHVRTAYSKGATMPRVLFVHVLKNAMIPIISRVMISIPFLVTGSLLLETFFGIPGVGAALYEAINQQDFPVIKSVTVLISLLMIASTILNDILYGFVDPRVRLA